MKSLGLALLLAAVGGAAVPRTAAAHSASDAYLNLQVVTGAAGAGPAWHGEWDIALRDLDFVLHLDDDGDGRLTWKEVRRHQPQIEKYAYSFLHLSAAHARDCTITPMRQLIDEHADGAYAVLMFDVTCRGQVHADLALDYDLFFAVDPSHRAIVTLETAAGIGTAVLSPQNAQVRLGP